MAGIARRIPGTSGRTKSFVRDHMGRPLEAGTLKELAPLNRLLERDEAYGQLVVQVDQHGHDQLAFEMAHRWRSPEALLIPIGQAIAQVVVGEDFTQIKACEGHDCTLMFADRTRGRARRWCSMGVCGNRAKVTAYRHRKRAG